MPNTSKAATLEPDSSDTIDNVETKTQGHLRGAMQIFLKTKGLRVYIRTRRRRPPARSLPGTAARPWQDPCRGHLWGRGQARTYQSSVARRPGGPSNAATILPTRQAPAWQHAASGPTSQAPAWWHADLREGPVTAPAQQPASQRGAACLVSLDAHRSKARRRRRR